MPLLARVQSDRKCRQKVSVLCQCIFRRRRSIPDKAPAKFLKSTISGKICQKVSKVSVSVNWGTDTFIPLSKRDRLKVSVLSVLFMRVEKRWQCWQKAPMCNFSNYLSIYLLVLACFFIFARKVLTTLTHCLYPFARAG